MPCDGTCATCKGSGATNCLSCSGSNYLSYGAYECVGTCPGGQYAAAGNVCLACSINCVTCSGSGGNCESCGLSLSGIALYLYNSACIATCPNQYYAYSNFTCVPCHSSCYTCSGTALTNCLTCTSGSLVASNNTCQTNCPDGQYSQNSMCVACLRECATCQNITYCTSCQSVAGQDYYLNANNVCVIACPAGTYGSNYICSSCTSPC